MGIITQKPSSADPLCMYMVETDCGWEHMFPPCVNVYVSLHTRNISSCLSEGLDYVPQNQLPPRPEERELTAF